MSGLDTLEAVLKRVRALRKTLRSHTAEQVSRTGLRNEAKAIGQVWFSDVVPMIAESVSAEIATHYADSFTRLIRLSGANNRTSTYLSVLDGLVKSFADDLLIPAQQGRLMGSSSGDFDVFLSSAGDQVENSYMAEAIACANGGYMRAAAVLGWSAAIDLIHRKIEEVGFDKFNDASAVMTAQGTGRYKKFTKKQSVQDISDLREVFDNIILWVIDGMGMIDSNQATRLRSCFDMRCHGAHPGDAPITKHNLMSFFSDLEMIIFKNPKFALKNSQKEVLSSA